MTTVPENTNPVSPHTEAARDLLQRIRAVQEIVGSKTLLPGREIRKLINAASLPDDFLEGIAVAIETYDKLALVSEITSAEIRDVVVFSRAYRLVVDEMQIGGTTLLQEILIRRARVGQQALKTYNLAKGLNRPNDKAMLVPHITAMRRALGTRGRRKAPAPAEPAVPAEKKE